MDRHMAASLDHWLTTDPRDSEPDEPVKLHCTECGAFLKWLPERTEEVEDRDRCGGYVPRQGLDPECGISRKHRPHTFPVGGHSEDYRTCAKCGMPDVRVTW